jgi:hypothetical protein
MGLFSSLYHQWTGPRAGEPLYSQFILHVDRLLSASGKWGAFKGRFSLRFAFPVPLPQCHQATVTVRYACSSSLAGAVWQWEDGSDGIGFVSSPSCRLCSAQMELLTLENRSAFRQVSIGESHLAFVPLLGRGVIVHDPPHQQDILTGLVFF